MDLDDGPKVRAALSLRALKKSARKQAEHDLTFRKPTRNASAWLSRAANRHYQALLVSHVEKLEQERNQVQQICLQNKKEIKELRKIVAHLENQSKSRRKSNEKVVEENSVRSSEQTGDFWDLAVWCETEHIL